MLRRFALSVCALFGFAAVPAHAFTPESGFYWNPAEPGSGIAIEIQDNVLFLAGYVYDGPGRATWVTSAGTLTGNSAYSGTLDTFINGQCIGCIWTQNSYNGSAGPVSISFLTETSGNFTWGGRTFHIERFNFALGNKTQIMLGEWQAVLDMYDRGGGFASYPFYGEIFVVDLINTTLNPNQFQGCRPTTSLSGFCSTNALANHDLAGNYDSGSGKHVIVVTDVPGSNKTFFAYYVTVGTDQFDGAFEICSPGTCGRTSAVLYPVRGWRSASNHFVQTGSGPSAIDKSAGAARGDAGLSQAILEHNGGRMPQGMDAAQAKSRYGIDLGVLGPQAERLSEDLVARAGKR